MPEAKRPKTEFEREIERRLTNVSDPNKRLKVMLEYMPIGREAMLHLNDELLAHPVVRTLIAAQELSRRAMDEDLAPREALVRIQQMITALIPPARAALHSKAAQAAAEAQIRRFS